jgi:phosphoenolpyruvate-protein kinase (PTS system EI component)
VPDHRAELGAGLHEDRGGRLGHRRDHGPRHDRLALYGLPAVVGTGFGTQTIKAEQTVRVDGDAGIVTILD